MKERQNSFDEMLKIQHKMFRWTVKPGWVPGSMQSSKHPKPC